MTGGRSGGTNGDPGGDPSQAPLGDGSAAPAEWRSAIASWKAATEELPAGFEARVLAALEAAGSRGLESSSRSPAPARWHFAAAAAAACLLVAAPWFVWRSMRVAPGPAAVGSRATTTVTPASAPSSQLLVVDAVRAVEAAEREHLRAVAHLEVAARAMLDRAGDPDVGAEHASLLLGYRDRLRHLDATLAEIDRFVDQNPYHPKARALRIAALREKSDLLRDVVALPLPTGGA